MGTLTAMGKEPTMLHLQYIGLLNTDRQRKGPVQLFLQGRESRDRYVLDRLPPWIERMLGPATEMFMEVCYISGAKLELFHPETREAMYRALVEGGYKVRQVSGGAEYVEVSQVFTP
jgi:hypothetical protein